MHRSDVEGGRQGCLDVVVIVEKKRSPKLEEALTLYKVQDERLKGASNIRIFPTK